MFTRWLICDLVEVTVAGRTRKNPVLPPEEDVQAHSRVFDFNGKAICRVDFDDEQWSRYQDAAGYTSLPSLQTPASKLRDAHKAFFAGGGVTIAADDVVLNVLRGARTCAGYTPDMAKIDDRA